MSWPPAAAPWCRRRRFELADPRLLDAAAAAPLPAALRPALRVVPGVRFLRLSRAL